MVRDGQQFMQLAPWLVIFPCLAIGVLSVGTVLAGDKLRDFVSRGHMSRSL
jgi:ABC-type dipeptide/oligopeptide/nickel transport system permease subunit